MFIFLNTVFLAARSTLFLLCLFYFDSKDSSTTCKKWLAANECVLLKTEIVGAFCGNSSFSSALCCRHPYLFIIKYILY